MMIDEYVRIILRVVKKSIDEKSQATLYLSFRLLSFFSSEEVVKLEILNMLHIKNLFGTLKDGTDLDRKFILSILLDLIVKA